MSHVRHFILTFTLQLLLSFSSVIDIMNHSIAVFLHLLTVLHSEYSENRPRLLLIEVLKMIVDDITSE